MWTGANYSPVAPFLDYFRVEQVSAETVGVEIEGVDEKGEVKKVKRKKRKIKVNGLPELQYADEYDM